MLSLPSVFSPIFIYSALTQISRTYKFPPVVDPQRTTDMMEEEEKAMEYFEERKDILQLFSPDVWMDEFHKCVEEFIERHLLAAEIITATSVTAEDYSQLHGLRRLISGAIQEAELVRQPAYAATCAKLDKALVWDGRRCVIHTCYLMLPHITLLRSIDLRKFRQRYGW
jgi:hypothetical protein